MSRERQVHRAALIEWGRKQPESIVLSGDLTASCEADGFRQEYPDRFISMGLMEQNMMSFAAGLAREGLVPLVHTFGVFMYRRALDQVEMSISNADLPVRMFGFLPGVTTPGGPSHQATNDIGVLRTLANMTIVEVGDATDIEGLYELSLEIEGPLYVRMLRGEVSRIFPKGSKLNLNTARVLSSGSDIALLTSGICTEEAIRVTGLISDAGVSVSHLHVTTLKPFSDTRILEAMGNARCGVITMENHSSIGGLGSCVADMIAEEGLGKQLKRISTGDRYLQGASQAWLVANYGIGAGAVVDSVEQLIGESLGISTENLATAEAGEFTGANQLEAL